MILHGSHRGKENVFSGKLYVLQIYSIDFCPQWSFFFACFIQDFFPFVQLVEFQWFQLVRFQFSQVCVQCVPFPGI